MVDLLRPLGFTVHEATNAVSGLAKAREFLSEQASRVNHVILVDLRMAGVSGFELIRQLRADKKLSDVVIIVLSGSFKDADQEKSAALGSNAFLTKPINASELFETLHQHAKIEWIYPSTSSGHRPQSANNNEHEATNGSQASDCEASPWDKQPNGANGRDALQIPPTEQLEKLKRLAKIGHVRAIKRLAQELRSQDQAFNPFVLEVERFNQRYHVRKIHQWMQSLLEEPAV